jgi:hypothetical protein
MYFVLSNIFIYLVILFEDMDIVFKDILNSRMYNVCKYVAYAVVLGEFAFCMYCSFVNYKNIQAMNKDIAVMKADAIETRRDSIEIHRLLHHMILAADMHDADTRALDSIVKQSLSDERQRENK